MKDRKIPEETRKAKTGRRTAKAGASSKSKPEKARHAIAAAIDKCIRRVSDIEYSLGSVMPQTAYVRIKEMKKEVRTLRNYVRMLNQKRLKGADRALAVKNVLSADSRLVRYAQSELMGILETGHFLTLFSSFDAFTGELLGAIYRSKPNLYGQLNRTMTVSEVLQYSSVEDLKEIVLMSEVEAFRRESYEEQFEALEKRFGLPLRKFPHWPDFVECAQRRNLFTHCDGLVSDQYLSACRKAGYTLGDDVKMGTRLTLRPRYLGRSCQVIIEVCLKLGQILWRKIFPGQLDQADKHLLETQYGFLEREEWPCALMAGDFALSLPDRSSDVDKRIMTVNYAIALQRCNDNEKAMKALDSLDWTAVAYDFRLADRVLRHDYDGAYSIMLKIDKKGEHVDEHAYHAWPLFYEFRQSEQFARGYKAVYGYEFTDKLRLSVSGTERRAKEVVTREEEAAEVQKPASNGAAANCASLPQETPK